MSAPASVPVPFVKVSLALVSVYAIVAGVASVGESLTAASVIVTVVAGDELLRLSDAETVKAIAPLALATGV